MLWVLAIWAILLLIGAAYAKWRPRPEPFGLDYDGLPRCPECGVGMDYLDRQHAKARCHDCRKIFPAPPDLETQALQISVRDLQKEVRQLRERNGK